jgi:hypothetical protein
VNALPLEDAAGRDRRGDRRTGLPESLLYGDHARKGIANLAMFSAKDIVEKGETFPTLGATDSSPPRRDSNRIPFRGEGDR